MFSSWIVSPVPGDLHTLARTSPCDRPRTSSHAPAQEIFVFSRLPCDDVLLIGTLVGLARERVQIASWSPSICHQGRLATMHCGRLSGRGVRKECAKWTPTALTKSVSSDRCDDHVHWELDVSSRQRRWGPNICSDTQGVSHDSLFDAMEVSVFKSWVFRPARETVCL